MSATFCARASRSTDRSGRNGVIGKPSTPRMLSLSADTDMATKIPEAAIGCQLSACERKQAGRLPTRQNAFPVRIYVPPHLSFVIALAIRDLLVALAPARQ